MACLMLGYLHNFMSRTTYLQMRVIMDWSNIHLPHWDTVQRTRERIKNLVDFKIYESISVWGNKLFNISLKTILANVS